MKGQRGLVRAAAVWFCAVIAVGALGIPEGSPADEVLKVPAATEQGKALAGHVVWVERAIDLDGDGVASEVEADFLRRWLDAARVKTRMIDDMKEFTDVKGLTGAKGPKLVVMGPAAGTEPKKPAGADADEPLKVARYEHEMERWKQRPELVKAFGKMAEGLGIAVIEGVDVRNKLGLEPPTAQQLSALRDFYLAAALERRLPEVRFANIPSSDVMDFMRDVTGLEMRVDRAAFKAAGLDVNKPVTLRVQNVTTVTALELVVLDAYGKAAEVRVDGEGLVITSSQAAGADKGLRRLDEAMAADPPGGSGELLQQALLMKASAMHVDETPADVLVRFRDLYWQDVDVDVPALEAAGFSLTAKVKVDLPESTLAKQLVGLVKAMSPKLALYAHRNEVLRVTTVERAGELVKQFPGSRMVTGEEKAPEEGK